LRICRPEQQCSARNRSFRADFACRVWPGAIGCPNENPAVARRAGRHSGSGNLRPFSARRNLQAANKNPAVARRVFSINR
jgi:hypothetical protein